MNIVNNLVMSWNNMCVNLCALFTNGTFSILCLVLAGIMFGICTKFEWRGKGAYYIEEVICSIFIWSLTCGLLAGGGWIIKTFF